MYHLTAYFENQDGAGARQALAALSDPFTNLFVANGDELRIPAGFNECYGAYLGLDQTVDTTADLVNSTFRKTYGVERYSLPFLNNGVEPGDPPLFNDLRAHPVVSRPGDRLRLFTTNNPACATDQFGVLFMGSGLAPVDPRGGFWTRFTTTASAMTANTWNQRAITFDEQLEDIVYSVLGVMPLSGSTSAIALRLNFSGQEHRPGVLARDDTNDQLHPAFETPGAWGELGKFTLDAPPRSEWLVDLADNEAQEGALFLKPAGARPVA